jgi:hypothetical protein
MGRLATYLQQQFQVHCPPGWQAYSEAQVLSAELCQLLGYAPQVDVMLTHENGRRLWIEFEISRADPVANHAKFATAHLFQPQPETDTFVSMITPHVASGRRNLAANMIQVMRYVGMRAYQTSLFPTFPAHRIKQLNYLNLATLKQENLNVSGEIHRALAVSQALAPSAAGDIHFVANNMEAILNLRRWNREITTGAGQHWWGRRTITYFVYDRRSHLFAPAKFCAYVSIAQVTAITLPTDGSTMTMQQYAHIDHDEPIFDGQRARQHLVRNLGMTRVKAQDAPAIQHHFQRWVTKATPYVQVHPVGASFLVPPAWS